MMKSYNLFAAQDETPERRAWHRIYADYFAGCKLILDIGCGAGTFLGILRERGLAGLGIDFDPEMVERCHSLGLDAQMRDMRELAGWDIHPDGIHASHVIEHLDGPAAIALLEWCAQALSPGGIIVLRTPNWSNEQVKNGGFWLDYTHVRPYPLQLLLRILRVLDLEILQSGYEPMGWQDTFVVARKPGAFRPDVSPTSSSRRALPGVRWEGGFFLPHSLAHVNCELASALLDLNPRLALSLWPTEPHHFSSDENPQRLRRLADRFFREPSGDPCVTVRHRWPPDFTPPPSGPLVIMQPWEYGAVPVSWLKPMVEIAREIWAPSCFVKQCYISAGVPESKVAVIPNGVNTEVFYPQVSPALLPVHQSCRFLYVGPLLHRKGVDLLLEAYTSEFTSGDDVALIIKDLGGGSPYTTDPAFVNMLRKKGQSPSAPEILYLAQNLSLAEMASLYRACTCLVHPYRGEGFGLPIAEAMACGLPVIVTGAGACLDFCDASTAYLVEAERKESGTALVGQLETAGSTWWYEADLGALRQAMRRVYENRQEAQAIGARAAEKIKKEFTWEHAARAVLGRLAALTGTQL